MEKMTKALVTGANGFIGSHLVEALLKNGYAVTCLVRKTSDLKWLRGLTVKFAYGDCADRDSLYPAVKGMDYVYHAGALIHAPDWQTYYDTNTLGTENLVRACCEASPRLRRFVFVSSISATGSAAGRGILLNEQSECRPVSDYGKSKLLAERMLNAYKKEIPITIIRPPNVLGTRQKELYSILKLLKYRLKPALGTKDKQVSFCFVHDLVRAMILAGEKDEAAGETYFVTDGNVYSWGEVLDLGAKILGVEPFVIRIPHGFICACCRLLEFEAQISKRKPFFTRQQVKELRERYWTYDGSKIEKQLGFKPQVKLEDGLRETIGWYKQQGLL